MILNNENYYIPINKLLNFKIKYDSVEMVLKNIICSFNDANTLYNIHKSLWNETYIRPYYFYRKLLYKSSDNIMIEDNDYWGFKFSYSELEYKNLCYKSKMYYIPAYTLYYILNVMQNKLHLSYKIAKSPCDETKIIIYIVDNKTEKIITFLRNNDGMNEFNSTDYKNIAYTIYNYFFQLFLKFLK